MTKNVTVKICDMDVELAVIIIPGDPGCRHEINGDPGSPPIADEVDYLRAWVVHPDSGRRLIPFGIHKYLDSVGYDETDRIDAEIFKSVSVGQSG